MMRFFFIDPGGRWIGWTKVEHDALGFNGKVRAMVKRQKLVRRVANEWKGKWWVRDMDGIWLACTKREELATLNTYDAHTRRTRTVWIQKLRTRIIFYSKIGWYVLKPFFGTCLSKSVKQAAGGSKLTLGKKEGWNMLGRWAMEVL